MTAAADWKRLGARLGRFVASASGRTDLLVGIGPGHPNQPPGMFVPALARIEFSGEQVLNGAHPADVDPRLPSGRAKHPVLMGVAAHEAAHAAHTQLSFPADADPAVVGWAAKLEEPRIESRLVRRAPKYRPYLRASAAALIHMPEGEDQLPFTEAVTATILLVGRSIGGVLTPAEVHRVEEVAARVIGSRDYKQLKGWIAEAVTLPDGDVTGLLQVAARVAGLIPDFEQPPSAEPEQGADGEPTDGDTQGSGSAGNHTTGQGDTTEGSAGAASGGGAGQPRVLPCGSLTSGDVDGDPFTDQTPESTETADGGTTRQHPGGQSLIEKAVDDATRQAQTQARRELAAATSPQHRAGAGQDAEQQQRDAQLHQKAVDAAQRPGGQHAANIVLSDRAVDPQVTDQMLRLTALLRAATYRGMDRALTRSILPPGRLNTSELMQQEAQRQMRSTITARPWKATRRRETVRPRLLVGIAGDVSQSMEPYQQQVANITYALTNTVNAMGGEVAAVAWNSTVGVTAAPGQRLSRVVEATCAGGSAGCPAALTQLDGMLRLASRPDRVRLVVVVTDGGLPNNGHGSHSQTNEVIDRLHRAGVHILWVTPTPDRRVSPEADTLVMPTPTGGGQVWGQKLGEAVAGVLASN